MPASPQAPWRIRPPREAIARLVETLEPGATLGRVTRLRGGLASGVFRVGFRRADGSLDRFIVRLPTHHRLGARANSEREYTTLRRLAEAGVPSPRPLHLDLDGAFFGMAAYVMSDAGRALVAPRRLEPWLRDLAAAANSLRGVTPEHFDLRHLEIHTLADVMQKIGEGLPDGLKDDALAQTMLEALQRNVDSLAWGEPCLVHDDYWPGNTVWRRGRLSAIVDWTPAKVGDPREDIAQCRIDLAMIHGPGAAARFLAYARELAPGGVDDVWFFDLLRGIDALDSFRSWLVGYRDIGLRELTEGVMEMRLRAFLTDAVAAAG